LASLIELLTILATSFALNLIPFAGPSNLFIASNAALISTADPISIGLLVAFGAATAKLLHYITAFFIGKHIGEQRRKQLDRSAKKLGRWAPLAIFIAAATPIPDDPVIIPLGLLKYSPAKFYASYFVGKLLIGVGGAYAGRYGEHLLGSVLNHEALIIISVISTIVITIILLKVDVEKIVERILRKRPEKQKEE